MTNRLAEKIEYNLSEERVESLWQGIDARRAEYQRPASKKRVFAVAGALAIAAGVAMSWFYGVSLSEESKLDETAARSGAPVPLSAGGAALRSANEKLSVDLDDGSQLTLAPRSQVIMVETNSADVALSLQEGRVACDVAKNQGRKFSVRAGDVTVRVVGTRFTVERKSTTGSEQVLVEVEEGVVEVNGPDGVQKKLSAGESWSVRTAPRDSKTASETSLPDKNAASSQVPVRATPFDKQRADKNARDLFEEARAKRNAGDAAGAARLYQEFLSKYSSDGRAGVAALELGRLRMDQLGDTRGAIAPLIQAASRGAGGLGDDAIARLAQAYSQLGNTAACKNTRARYMKSYPKGVHIERIRGLCP